MAPNFQSKNISLFQCSSLDLELIAPSGKNAAFIEQNATNLVVVDSDDYWENDDQQVNKGMTVERMEQKQAALGLLQHRIQLRLAAKAAIAQSPEFSVARIEETLKQDAARRLDSQACECSATEDYWNEASITSKSARIEERNDYWYEREIYSEGQTAEKFELRNAGKLQLEEKIRLFMRMSEFIRERKNE